MATFSAELALNGKTATGIDVPAPVIESLGGGRRPAVLVAFRGYSYRTTVGVRGGRCLIPVSAEHRAAAGVQAGDRLEVTLTLDDAPREVEVPSDLAEALQSSPTASRSFEALSPSGRSATCCPSRGRGPRRPAGAALPSRCGAGVVRAVASELPSVVTARAGPDQRRHTERRAAAA